MIIRFGNYELDDARFELRRAGSVVSVERRVFDVILLLVKNADRVVSKAELLAAVWTDRHVEEGSISVAIAAARRALGDDAITQRMIRTCRGRGYQFAPTPAQDPEPSESPDSDCSASDALRLDFVGRSNEIAMLTEAARGLHRGQSALFLLSGEPGIGKTRLLDEFFIGADRLDLLVTIGRCPESGDAPAMWPWAQVLRSLQKQKPGDLSSRLSPRSARALAMIAPESVVAEWGPGTQSGYPEVPRFQLYEGLLEAIELYADRAELVIALDDVHRADTSTLGFLRFAARELRHRPILFLATHRIGELRGCPFHSQTLAELAREPHATLLRLQGLGPDETTKLFSRLTSESAHAKTKDEIFRKTAGNPFFIRQLATLAATSRGDGETASEVSLPPTLRHAILQQMAGLNSTSRAVLAAAAVIGRDFCVRTLADVVDLDALQLNTALGELVDSSILQRDLAEPGRLSFAHVLVRDALYEETAIADRRLLHEQIGRSFVAQFGTLSETHIAEIAYHLFEAQTPETIAEALSFNEIAARAASARSAHDVAERHYLRALQALDLTDAANETSRCRLLLSLGKEQCRAGVRSEAKRTFARAATLARTIGSAEELGDAALGVAPGFLAVEVGVADAFLEDLLQESLDHLGDGNPALRARLAARLAMALHWTDAQDRMHQSIALARALDEQAADPAVTLDVNFARWFCEWQHASFRSRDAIAVEIQKNADSLRNREMSLIGTMLRMVGMLERGETASFDVTLESFSSVAANLRQPYSLWYETLYRSMRMLFAGKIPCVQPLLERFQSIAARVEDANATNSLIMQNSFFRWETDELEPMITWISEGARRSPTLQAFRAALAWSNAKVGRYAEARREFDALASCDFSDFPERFDWPISVALCAEVCGDIGDAKRAQRLFELLRPIENRSLVLGLGVLSFGSAARLLGRLSETMGRGEQAEAYFRLAIERNAAAGAHAWTAHTKLDYALLLARTGGQVRRDYRVQLASEVLETATDLGLVSLKRRAESFLATGRADGVGPASS